MSWEKVLRLIKVLTPLVSNLFCWSGTVGFLPYFCVPREFEYPVRYKAGFSKVSKWTKSDVPNWFASKGNNGKVICHILLIFEKFLSCTRFELSKSQFLSLDRVETGVLLSDFAHQLLGVKKLRRSRHFLNFTWRCWNLFNSISESKCNNQKERKLGPFQNLNVKNCQVCTHRVVLLLGLCLT